MRVDGPVGRVVQRAAGSRWFARVAPPILTPLDRFLHRLTGGRVLLSRGLLPSLLLTTTGARTGLPREVPLACVPDGDVIYLVGSNFGRERHPAWTANLLATPRARVSYGRERFDVDAAHLDTDEKAAVWPKLLAVWPTYDRYVERSGRDIRVFRLTRAQPEPQPRPTPSPTTPTRPTTDRRERP